jgi:uncharacterized protein (TIGR03083 family)
VVRTGSDPPTALLEQSRTVREWLAGLDAADFTEQTPLPGWDVRTLTGHLVLVHRGLAQVLARPTGERPLPNHEFVRRYRRDVEMITESTLLATADHSGPVLVEQLGGAIHEIAELLASHDPRSVVGAARGPVTAGDILATRIVEVVVHADDLSRSLPERAPILLHRAALSRCTRTLAEILAGQQPGRSVEVRVPPYAAVQCSIASAVGDAGPSHTRGTPPNVVETDPLSFLRLATGRITWDQAMADGTIRASGLRADLTTALPLFS